MTRSAPTARKRDPDRRLARTAGSLLSRRFRGFLPVVVDLETGGFNCRTDALLEMAAVLLTMDDDGTLRRGDDHATAT